MDIRLRCTNPEASEKIKAHATKRFSRLTKFLGQDEHHVDVHLDGEHNPAIRDSAVVRARVSAFGDTLTVEAAKPDLISAIDVASDRLLDRVRRRHDRVRHRRLARQAT